MHVRNVLVLLCLPLVAAPVRAQSGARTPPPGIGALLPRLRGSNDVRSTSTACISVLAGSSAKGDTVGSRVTTGRVTLPEAFGVAKTRAHVSLGGRLLWIDAEDVTVSSAFQLLSTDRLVITARRVEFGPGAFIMVETPAGASPEVSTGMSSNCAVAGSPKAVVTILARDIVVSTPSVAPLRAGEGVDSNVFVVSGGEKQILVENMEGLRRRAGTPNEESVAVATALVRWPDAALRRFLGRLMVAPYDSTTVVAASEELAQLAAGPYVRAGVVADIRNLLSAVGADKSPLGLNSYWFPVVDLESLRKFLADVEKVSAIMGEVSDLNARVASYDSVVFARRAFGDFSKTEGERIARELEDIRDETSRMDSALGAAQEEFRKAVDSRTAKEAAYEQALQRHQWTQQRLLLKAKRRQRTGKVLQTAAVVAATVATGGVGTAAASTTIGTVSMGTVAATTAGVSAAYSTFADARTARELCGRRTDVLSALGIAYERTDATRASGAAISESIKGAMAMGQSSFRTGRCYYRASSGDEFGRCMVSSGGASKPGAYTKRARLDGGVAAARGMMEAGLALDSTFASQQEFALPDCQSERPLPAEVAESHAAYAASERDVAERQAAIQGLFDEGQRLLEDEVILLAASGELGTVTLERLKGAEVTQAIVDDLRRRRNVALLWLGTVVEAHRRVAFAVQPDSATRATAALEGALLLRQILDLAGASMAVSRDELVQLGDDLAAYRRVAESAGWSPTRKQGNQTTLQVELLCGGEAQADAFIKWIGSTTDAPFAMDVCPKDVAGQARAYRVHDWALEVTTVRSDGVEEVITHLRGEAYLFPFGSIGGYGGLPSAAYCLGPLRLPTVATARPVSECGFAGAGDESAGTSGWWELGNRSSGRLAMDAAPAVAREPREVVPWNGVFRVVLHREVGFQPVATLTKARAHVFLSY